MSNLATYENCQMSLFDIVCHDLEDHVLQCDRDEEICTSCDVAQQIGDFLFLWLYVYENWKITTTCSPVILHMLVVMV